MAAQQTVGSNASSRKRPYKEEEDAETAEDVFNSKFSFHLSRMHYMLPHWLCKTCISDFYADKSRVTYEGKRSRMCYEMCEKCTRFNMKMSQLYGKYFSAK